MVNKVNKYYNEQYGVYIYKSIPGHPDQQQQFEGFVPPQGFGLKLTFDDIVNKKKIAGVPVDTYNEKRGIWRITLKTWYGSHADEWEQFEGFGKTRDDAVKMAVDDFLCWLNYSMYAGNYREKLGITSDDYINLKYICTLETTYASKDHKLTHDEINEMIKEYLKLRGWQ